MRGRRLDIRGRRLKRYDDRATDFISSIEFDAPIARHVLRINTAHMLSLVRSGEVEKDVGKDCLKFLLHTAPEASFGKHAEDFHQALEQYAVDMLGVEKAGYLNLGKSRNDQVACAIRMEARERIIGLAKALTALQVSLITLVRRHGRMIIPGFTHLQHAQPVTLAHHFVAHFDAIQRDFERLMQLYERVNLSPMGAAALAGTSVNLDRRSVASLLGFEGVIENAMDAVSSRDFAVEALSCAGMVMLDMSRIAEEVILWSSKEFGFVEVSDEYAASSSIMPQKKNPVTAEVVRAKCGSVLGSLQAVCAILKGLPYSYNLDLQEVTPHVWDGLANTHRSVEMMGATLSTMKFNPRSIQESMRNDYSTATSLANYLVKSSGLSFREAHAVVGEIVRISFEKGLPFAEAAKDLPKVPGAVARLDQKTLKDLLDPAASLDAIATQGGANPRFIRESVARRLQQIKKNASSASKLERKLTAADAALLKQVISFLKEVRN